MQYEPLSQTLTLPNGTVLRNRFAKSATSEAMADRDTGAPTEELARVYERFALGGAGLLITGNVVIDPNGRTEPGNVIIESDRDLDALSKWAASARQHGASLWMQLNHAGRQTPRSITNDPVAPSAVGLRGFAGLFATPRALTTTEIKALIERFAAAASVAKLAGFGGVQIHAAHGYLVSQFLSPLTNLRTDEWGGTPERRMAFLREIVRAVREAVGTEFPIGVKLNSADFQRGGFSQDESMAVVAMLESEGIDLLEISGGSYEKSAMMGDKPGAAESTRAREAYFLDYAEAVRTRTKLPLLLTGGMRTAKAMSEVIEQGHVDLVGMARPLLVEPDLPNRILAGKTDGAAPVRIRLGVKLLDNMLQIVWYQAQLRRMGKGRAPDPRLGRVGALIAGFARSYAFNPVARLFRRRRTTKLVAARSS